MLTASNRTGQERRAHAHVCSGAHGGAHGGPGGEGGGAQPLGPLSSAGLAGADADARTTPQRLLTRKEAALYDAHKAAFKVPEPTLEELARQAALAAEAEAKAARERELASSRAHSSVRRRQRASSSNNRTPPRPLARVLAAGVEPSAFDDFWHVRVDNVGWACMPQRQLAPTHAHAAACHHVMLLPCFRAAVQPGADRGAPRARAAPAARARAPHAALQRPV